MRSHDLALLAVDGRDPSGGILVGEKKTSRGGGTDPDDQMFRFVGDEVDHPGPVVARAVQGGARRLAHDRNAPRVHRPVGQCGQGLIVTAHGNTPDIASARHCLFVLMRRNWKYSAAPWRIGG